MKGIGLAIVFLLAGAEAFAQQDAPPTQENQSIREWNQRLFEAGANPAPSRSDMMQDYRIGPEDLLEVSVFEVPELSRTVRVSASGEISLPLLGNVRAAGLSPTELERALTERLQRSYVKEPQVSIFLKEYRSDPVSVVGAVKVPGLYYIQTERTLIEVLAMAQGFSEGPLKQPGRSVIITHKPNTRWVMRDAAAAAQSTPGAATAQDAGIVVPIKDLVQSGDPKWNVPIYPGDVVKVVPAGTFYVAGDVNHPGGFPLTDFDNVSVIQALALAGGTKKSASLKGAVIIRRDAAGNRVEEVIDLRQTKTLRSKASETTLGENDILFVPGSVGKEAALRGIESAIQIATGMLVWRVP